MLRIKEDEVGVALKRVFAVSVFLYALMDRRIC